MSTAISPRLPRVAVLQPHCTGPEYSRWRRSIKFALETRGLWKYCNGTCPMPMPEACPNALLSSASTTNLQHNLLDERRAWVKQDREVKLDIFLSLAEETMHEVFGVGSPLSPLNLTARQMIRTLDRRYRLFKFEPYHHTFCHFLNLHIDQHISIHEFNKEFSTTLEDLIDHGQGLSNTQACSAYLSKLRCTQNPWVVKMLEDWDLQHRNIGVLDLIEQSTEWFLIRPLATKTSPTFCAADMPEEHSEDSEEPGSDTTSRPITTSSGTGPSLHSRLAISSVIQSANPHIHAAERDTQTTDTHNSQDPPGPKSGSYMYRNPSEELQSSTVTGLAGSEKEVTNQLLDERALSTPSEVFDDMLGRTLIGSQSSLAKIAEVKHAQQEATPKRNVSPPMRWSLQSRDINATLRQSSKSLEMYPVQRNDLPSIERKSLLSLQQRALPPTLDLVAPTAEFESSYAIPWPSTPDLPRYSESSHAEPDQLQCAQEEPNLMPDTLLHKTREEGLWQGREYSHHTEQDKMSQERKHSTASTILSLPLQGARDPTWNDQHESKGGYLSQPSPREHIAQPP